MKVRIRKRDFSCHRSCLTLRGSEYLPAECADAEDFLGTAGTAAQDCVAEGSGGFGGRRRLPAAIVSHGFMANSGSVRHYAKLLAEVGFAAFCFDFAGGCAVGGKSDGATTDMSVMTEVEDLSAVLDEVRSLSYVDPDNILLMGCSQGGLVTALLAARRPADVARIALFYPALCIPDDARAGKMMFARFNPHDVPETFWCGPMRLGRRYAADVMDMDPFALIPAYDGPVLIVQGSADRIVDPSYAERAFEAYGARTGDRASVELKMIEGGGHGFILGCDRQAMGALLDWL